MHFRFKIWDSWIRHIKMDFGFINLFFFQCFHLALHGISILDHRLGHVTLFFTSSSEFSQKHTGPPGYWWDLLANTDFYVCLIKDIKQTGQAVSFMLIVQYYRRGELKDMFGFFLCCLALLDIFSSCLLVHFVSKHTYTHIRTQLETRPLTALARLTRGKLVWSTRSHMGWVFLLLCGFPKLFSVFSVCLQAHM